jgi:hypothetical protein
MKLAEALILRATAQKRIAQLRERLLRNAKVQQGDKPSEDPQELMRNLEQASEELLDLIQRINRTNVRTELEPGLTLADALAVRDVLGTRHEIYRKLAKNASVTHDRYSRSEVKFESTVTVAEIEKRADRLAIEHRELDTKIQAANWSTDLLE